ncbi:MAG TPA: hypothetical protein VM681_10785 [Candidatus Thermoplasmatota archaeon]|nr:hypothetical protein [Candidatus Thermoplasmatota archaeon]
MDWELTTAFNVAGGVAVIAFGLFVASVRPRTEQATAVAAFLFAFGAAVSCINLAVVAGPASPLVLALSWAAAGFSVAQIAATAFVLRVVPARLAPGERVLLLIPVVTVAAMAWAGRGVLTDESPTIAALGPGVPFYLFFAWISLGLWYGLLLVMAARVARRAAAPAILERTPLLAAALTFYPFSSTGRAFSTDPVIRGASELFVVFAVVVALAWLWSWHRAGRPRVGRNLAWLGLGIAVAGLLEGALAGAEFGSGIGLNGIARLLTVAVLSYAVVRHQLLGIDVKVRWGISKTTVAAIFITVFFVISEAAQVVFSTEDNEYFGIAAAALLVFAIAPLMQFADRVAHAAVPVGSPTTATPAGTPASRRQDVYRAAVRYAIREGRVTRAEERHLADLAAELGIDASTALSLRETVEKEASQASTEARWA